MEKFTTLIALAAIVPLLNSCGQKEDTAATKDSHSDCSSCKHCAAKEKKEEIVAGPNNGRLLVDLTPQTEIIVLKDGKVQVGLFDADLKVIPAGSHTVNLTTGEAISPVELSFVAQGDVFISEQTLPEGDKFPSTISVSSSTSVDPATTKFTLSLEDCKAKECANSECRDEKCSDSECAESSCDDIACEDTKCSDEHSHDDCGHDHSH